MREMFEKFENEVPKVALQEWRLREPISHNNQPMSGCQSLWYF
jgi:hypothetical protein